MKGGEKMDTTNYVGKGYFSSIYSPDYSTRYIQQEFSFVKDLPFRLDYSDSRDKLERRSVDIYEWRN